MLVIPSLILIGILLILLDHLSSQKMISHLNLEGSKISESIFFSSDVQSYEQRGSYLTEKLEKAEKLKWPSWQTVFRLK